MSVGRTVVRLRARTGAKQPPHDLEAEIAPDVTVGAFADAVADRLELNGTTGLAAVLERTGSVLRGDEPLLAAGVRNGDTLALKPANDIPGGPPVPTSDRFDLVVVGGPAAGQVVSLPPGTYVIGRDASCDVTVEDPSMSRRHLRVKIDAGRVMVVDTGSNNGTWVRDMPLRHHEAYTLTNGEVLRLARTLISIRPSRPRLDALSSDGTGNVNFNRPPRVPRPWRPQKVTVPAPPGKPVKARLPLVASLIPLVLGGVMYLVYPNPIMIAFMAMAPVMALFSFFEERRGGKKASGEALKRWDETLAKLDTDLHELAVEEERERNLGAPDAGELMHRAISHSADLWERRPTDPDFLHVRIGTADQPAQYEVSIESGGEEGQRKRANDVESKNRTIPAAPVMVAVPDAGAVGLGGAPPGVIALTRWLLVQAITQQSPRELAIAVGVRPELVSEFGWLKWAPHVQSSGSPVEGDPLAVGPIETRRLVEQVIALQRRRKEEQDRLGGALGAGRRMFLLLVLDEQVAPERSLIAELLGQTGRHDVAVLWLGHVMRDLPGECRVTIEHDPHLASVVLTDARTGAVVEDVTVDGMTRANAREVALALAPVRDTSTSGLRSGIPSRITLLELLGAKEHDADDTLRRWNEDAERGLGAPIGASGEGPVHVDLRADGPHALIGGTTGAGKSELLQTLVASLAVRHPPTRLTFLLVDYKGGAAFKECVGLPHTVGFVTDLDSHLTQRALTSLNAELKRREHILRDAGAKDLIDMERRSGSAPPSLVIVIDEFATLAKEVPEFVEGVVDVAQRGRSLGVHLVLATQRPGGVVSDNIRANVNLRIALRMAAPAESADIVGVTDAARIARSNPGRAFARVGQAELTEFQSAYVGGITTISTEGPPIELRDFGFGPPPDVVAPARSSTAYGTVATDLEELVKAVNEAAELQRLPPQPSPWLPALEPIVPLASLDPTRDPVATFGVIDEPSLQRRTSLTHDFENDGSLLIYGASGSGKTTALRTIAVALAAQTPPDRLHLYGLDFATRGLNSLEGLPHCGGVVLGEDEERVTRLLHTIRKTLAVRRERFAARGAFTLSEYNRAAPEGEQLPRIVVLFDGYAAFHAAFERINLGELVDLMPRLVADSRPLGVHFVITAERRAAISGALSGIITSKLILRMADTDEYSSLGLDIRTVKDMKLPPGRGFISGNLETQVALVGSDATGEGQLAAVAAGAKALRERFGDGHVPPVAPLPTGVERTALPPGTQLRPVLGLGDDELEALAVDLQDAHFLIAGPYRSGRSTTLETIARSLLSADPGAQVHLLAPRRSPLPGANVPWTSVSRGVEECDAKASELASLASELEEGDRPLFVLVDDGDELAETLGASALEQLVRRGRDVTVRLVVAAETQAVMRAYGGWLRELRKDEHGVLLDPDLDVDGDLLGGGSATLARCVRLLRRSNPVWLWGSDDRLTPVCPPLADYSIPGGPVRRRCARHWRTTPDLAWSRLGRERTVCTRASSFPVIRAFLDARVRRGRVRPLDWP